MNSAVTIETPPLELTILMPCLNEAETLASCIRKAKRFLETSGIVGEVLVADNGSTDGSPEIALAEGARVISVLSRGYGAALTGGIAAAGGEFVIMGDADDSYDFANLNCFIKALRDGADLVMGNRFTGSIAPGAMPWLHRYIGNPVLSWLGRLFFGISVGDFHCGLRGFSRRRFISLNMRTIGMEFASEMVVRAALEGYRIDEVPTTLKPDGRSGPSHLRTWHDGWRHLSFLLIYSPRWLFLYPGLALIGLGVVAGAILFPGGIRIGSVEFDIHTFMVTSFLFIVGVQAISFSVLARRFGAAHGLLPPPTRFARILNWITVERLLIIAVIFMAAGLAGLVGSAARWAAAGFGPLQYASLLRVLLVSMTAVATGAQLGLTAFLLSIIEIPKR